MQDPPARPVQKPKPMPKSKSKDSNLYILVVCRLHASRIPGQGQHGKTGSKWSEGLRLFVTVLVFVFCLSAWRRLGGRLQGQRLLREARGHGISCVSNSRVPVSLLYTLCKCTHAGGIHRRARAGMHGSSCWRFLVGSVCSRLPGAGVAGGARPKASPDPRGSTGPPPRGPGAAHGEPGARGGPVLVCVCVGGLHGPPCRTSGRR